MIKLLSGVFLIIGAMIGGGILAIPIVSAQLGFLNTFLLIVVSWIIMTKTGLYVLSLALTCPEKYNSYYSIVGKFLGKNTQKLTIFLFLWLLYFSLSSYISGCVSLLMSSQFHIVKAFSHLHLSILYVALFGSLIVVSAKLIIRLNVALIVLKLALLLFIVFSISSSASPFPIGSISLNQSGIFALFMVIVNAFGYQFIIPSMVSYYGKENHVLFRRILIIGTTIVFVLYVAWLCSIYSLIPMTGEHGLLSIYNSQNQLVAFNESLYFYVRSKLMLDIIAWFQAISLFGSFFCVSLAVFDFLVDIFKAHNRFVIGLLTFIPPLVLSLFSENMYVYAMSYAGYISIIQEVIIPFLAMRVYLKSLQTDKVLFSVASRD